MTTRSYRGLFWSLAIGGLALDLFTKFAIFSALWNPNGEGRVEIIPGVFRLIAQFTPAEPMAGDWRAPLQRLNGPMLPRVNQGALFGVGNDFQKYSNGFFAVVSLAAAAAIVWWSSRPTARTDRILCIALGMILAGTLGNFFDRVVFHGVRDFLYFYWFEWPVFNIADCLLVCGAGLLLLQAFLTPAEKPAAGQPETAAKELVEAK
jgi:lipoprotein signal peptidase